MIGINKAPIVAELKTTISRVLVEVNAKEIGQGACVAVIIQVPFSNSDGSGNNTEVMVGDRTAQPYQMLPGQESLVFYCNRLEDIMIRKRTAAMANAFVTLIIYERKGEYE